MLSLRMAICLLSGIHLPLSLSSSSLINVLNLYALFSFTGLCPHSSERKHNGKKESFPEWSTTSSKGCRPANGLNATKARRGSCPLPGHSWTGGWGKQILFSGPVHFLPAAAPIVRHRGACSPAYWSNHSSLAVWIWRACRVLNELAQLPSAPLSPSISRAAMRNR